jgi:hypothetical protein
MKRVVEVLLFSGLFLVPVGYGVVSLLHALGMSESAYLVSRGILVAYVAADLGILIWYRISVVGGHQQSAFLDRLAGILTQRTAVRANADQLHGDHA